MQAYLRKSSRPDSYRDSIRFGFAKLVAETRNEIIHKTVRRNVISKISWEEDIHFNKEE